MGEEELTSPQFRQAIFAEEMFGSAALVVVGEASSEDHKASILERIIKGEYVKLVCPNYFLLTLSLTVTTSAY